MLLSKAIRLNSKIFANNKNGHFFRMNDQKHGVAACSLGCAYLAITDYYSYQHTLKSEDVLEALHNHWPWLETPIKLKHQGVVLNIAITEFIARGNDQSNDPGLVAQWVELAERCLPPAS